MRSFSLLAGLALVGCTAPPIEAPERRLETISIPGTKVAFEMVRVAGDGRVRPFWIARRELTWGEFDRFYEFPEEQRTDGVTRPSTGKSYLGLSGLPAEFLEADRPVTNLRYHSALAYCEWLSRRTGRIFRLPTEAEWELAGGLETSPDQAWTQENSGGRTHRGGEKKPNQRGLVDLAGNVWEYCLEPDRPPDFGPVLRGGAWNTPAAQCRRTIPPEWEEADPNRPFSTWWFRVDFSQGMRIVQVEEPANAEERRQYARSIEIRILKGEERTAKVGGSVSIFSRVTGTVRNGGGRALDELMIKVYFLDPRGRPHLEDMTSNLTRRATFNVCLPALASSAHAGDHARPLRPGEERSFAVDVPTSFDAEADVDLEKFGAEVLYVQFWRN